MPFNGSGTYAAPSLPGSWNPAISGQAATPADWNTLLADLATALSNTICKDGQTVIGANIPLAGFKFTTVGNATTRDQYAAAGQVQDGTFIYAADTGAADAYVIALAPAITAYAVGQCFWFLVANSNLTTTPTLAVNGLTAGTVKGSNGTALVAGAMPGATIAQVIVSAVATGTPTFELQSINNLTTALNEARGTAIASATSTPIGAASGNFVHITGTTAITSFDTIQAGTRRHVVFDGILTLTYNATSLILPTAANITTAAGDSALFLSEGSGNWRCLDYFRASGTSLFPVATKSDQQTATSAVVLVTPSQQQSHPTAAKAWAQFNSSGTILASYNVASITNSATGQYTVTFTTAFAAATYGILVTSTGGTALVPAQVSQLAGSCVVGFINSTSQVFQQGGGTLVCFGGQ